MYNLLLLLLLKTNRTIKLKYKFGAQEILIILTLSRFVLENRVLVKYREIVHCIRVHINFGINLE